MLHKYTNGNAPPVVVIVAFPVFPPLHKTFVEEEIDATGPALLATVTGALYVHKLIS